MEEIKKTTKLDFDKIITADTVLFFDMDGTLIDTDFINFLSYKKAIHSIMQNGFDLSYNQNSRFNRSFLKNLIPNLNQIDYERIIQEKDTFYADNLHETMLKKDVFEILVKYSETNKTVLVTNCRKNRVLLTLNYFGLTDRFNNIFFRNINDSAKENKYKNAITSLNLLPDSIIVFENEKDEIADAIVAGIKEENIYSLI